MLAGEERDEARAELARIKRTICDALGVSVDDFATRSIGSLLDYLVEERSAMHRRAQKVEGELEVAKRKLASLESACDKAKIEAIDLVSTIAYEFERSELYSRGKDPKEDITYMCALIRRLRNERLEHLLLASEQRDKARADLAKSRLAEERQREAEAKLEGLAEQYKILEATLRSHVEARNVAAESGAYAWIGDGTDDIDSMGNSMVVMITGGQLRGLCAGRDAWIKTVERVIGKIKFAFVQEYGHRDVAENPANWTFEELVAAVCFNVEELRAAKSTEEALRADLLSTKRRVKGRNDAHRRAEDAAAYRKRYKSELEVANRELETLKSVLREGRTPMQAEPRQNDEATAIGEKLAAIAAHHNAAGHYYSNALARTVERLRETGTKLGKACVLCDDDAAGAFETIIESLTGAPCGSMPLGTVRDLREELEVANGELASMRLHLSRTKSMAQDAVDKAAQRTKP